MRGVPAPRAARGIRDGRALDLGGGKQRALLALLLLHANEVVSTRPADRRAVGRAAAARPPPRHPGLRLAAAQGARRRPRCVTRAPGYLLRVEPDELDARALRAASRRRSERGAPARRGGAAARGAGAVARPAARRLRATSRSPRPRSPGSRSCALAALEQRIDADLALGRHAELVGELEALVAEHPLRERLRGQLMLALYRSGRQAEALDAYRDARARARRGARHRARARAARARSRRSSGRTRRSTVARAAPPPSRRARRVRRPRARARRARRRPRRRLRRPRTARSCSPASPASARAGSPRS